MDERNPRSKLRAMKRRYFISTAGVYLGLFLFAYLVLEILFMIFEAGPYTRLAVIVVLFIVDGVITDHIINQTWKDRWFREAPDILDAIKAPEPALIPDGPVQEPVKENKNTGPEVRRFHRTQHKELETGSEAPAEIKKKESEPAASAADEAERTPLKRRFFQRRKKPAVSETTEPKPTVSEPDGTSSDRMKKMDGTNTVKPDASANTEQKPAADVNHSKPAPHDSSHKKRRTEQRTERSRQNKSDRSESADSNSSGRKPSSWMGTLEDMDTVELTDAIDRIADDNGIRTDVTGKTKSNPRLRPRRRRRSHSEKERKV